MQSNDTETTTVIYGILGYGEGARVVILHRSDAEEIYAALKTARRASKWAEFRQLCQHQYVLLAHENFRFEGEQLPNDADRFSHYQIPGADYDWPRYASGLYGKGLPEELVAEFGNPYSTVLGGQNTGLVLNGLRELAEPHAQILGHIRTSLFLKWTY